MMVTGASLANVTTEGIETAIQAYRAKQGRPTTFTEEIASEICERLKEGETLVSISRDPRMPSRPTIWDWTKHSASFANMVAEARQQWSHAFVENGFQTLVNADDSAMPKVKKAEAIAKHTLEIAARLNPNDYADKKQVQMDVRQVTIKTSSDSLRDYIDLD